MQTRQHWRQVAAQQATNELRSMTHGKEEKMEVAEEQWRQCNGSSEAGAGDEDSADDVLGIVEPLMGEWYDLLNGRITTEEQDEGDE